MPGKAITARMNLIVSVPRVEHYIRDSTSRDRVSYATATAMSAVVGYVLQELIDLAIGAMRAEKRERIMPMHIQRAVAEDPELGHIIPVSSIGTGTVPHEPDEEEEEGEQAQKKKGTRKRARKSPKKGKGKGKDTKAEASSRSKLIHKLIASISRSRGRSPAMKKLRSEAFGHLRKLSRTRSRGKTYSRSKRIREMEELMDETVHEISRSRNLSPAQRKKRAVQNMRILRDLSRSISRSRSRSRSQKRTKGGRCSRKSQSKGTKAGKRLRRGTGSAY